MADRKISLHTCSICSIKINKGGYLNYNGEIYCSDCLKDFKKLTERNEVDGRN